jgi:hypothetical protein
MTIPNPQLLPMLSRAGNANVRMGPAPGPTGLAALLARPGLRDALLATGSALLSQADQAGSLGGALGRALPMGLQAYQQGQQEAQMNALIETMPPEMQQVLRMLPAQQKGAALMQLLQPKAKTAPVAVNTNERLVDPDSGREIVAAVPEPVVDNTPTEVRTFRAYMEMSPEEQGAYRQFLAAQRPPGTTVNVNAGAEGGVQKAIGEAAFNTIAGAQGAQTNVQKIGAIDRVIEITSNPKFKEVSGPVWGGKVGELNARFASDPEARQLLAEFNAIGGQLTLATLEAFTGPKTDFEFQQARRLAQADPKMTPAEIQAGLKVFRAAAVEEAKRWADNIMDLDPSRLKFDPRDIAPQLDLARQINQQYGAGRTPAGGGQADPLGIRRR